MAKRDSAYWLARLQRDAPAVYADFLGGKFKSLAEARRAAGMFSARTPLHELKNAWKKASRAEQTTFVSWALLIRRSMHLGGVRTAFDTNQRMLPWAQSRVVAVIAARRLKVGALMTELGFSPHDISVTNAAHSGSRVMNPAIRAALEAWLEANKAVL